MTRTRRVLAALLLACGGFALFSGCVRPDDVTTVDEPIVVDVRTPEEFAEDHLEGALNVDWEDAAFPQWAATVDHDAEIVLYCRTGRRAASAQAWLTAQGFTDVLNAGSLENAAVQLGRDVVGLEGP